MNTPGFTRHNGRQRGFTLIELLVSLAITVVVMSGVVQVLTVSKSNFITGRELAISQENARYAMKFIADEIRMAGFTGCTSVQSHKVVNVINGSATSWYLREPGIEGFEHSAGTGTFPVEFRADVLASTDALVVRRAVSTGLHTTGHVVNSATLSLNKSLGDMRGQPVLLATPDCRRIAILQVTGPSSANPTTMVHNTGNPVVPGNCYSFLNGQNLDCSSADAPVKDPKFDDGSTIYQLRSEAYYIGSSDGVPALYRERMVLDSAAVKPTLVTAAEELVKGVENMQISYGVDTDSVTLPRDGLADKYVNANAIDNDGVGVDDVIVSMRITLRMRSQLPVYAQPVAYGLFEGVANTDGADRFLRQDISTTIMVRNF